MSTPLCVGFVGGGRIADLHAPAYLRSARARLFAVCDVDPAVRAARQRAWGVERAYASLEELLADPAIDAVEILTPHHLHADMAIAAATAGKHVSVQKPMARTLAECDAMIAAAREHQVKLKVFENFVFYEPYVRARALLEAGAIGEPLVVRMRLGAGYGGWRIPLAAWAWRMDEAACGGGPTIFDDGYHKLSLALELFGPVVEVTGFVERTLAVVDSPASIAWRHESGVLGYLDAALTPNLYVEGRYYPADERVEVTGTRGTLHVTCCSGQPLEAPPIIIERDGRVEAHTDLDTDWARSFDACVEDFVDAVLTDREPRLSGRRGRAVTAFALAAIEAGASGRTIALDPRGGPDPESPSPSLSPSPSPASYAADARPPVEVAP